MSRYENRTKEEMQALVGYLEGEALDELLEKFREPQIAGTSLNARVKALLASMLVWEGACQEAQDRLDEIALAR